jgi:hypothetical protein
MVSESTRTPQLPNPSRRRPCASRRRRPDAHRRHPAHSHHPKFALLRVTTDLIEKRPPRIDPHPHLTLIHRRPASIRHRPDAPTRSAAADHALALASICLVDPASACSCFDPTLHVAIRPNDYRPPSGPPAPALVQAGQLLHPARPAASAPAHLL